jgi:hypothetical protein
VHCPRCGREQEEGLEVCGHCGVYFARYRPRPVPAGPGPGRLAWLRERGFQVEPAEHRTLVIGRALAWVAMAAWAGRILTLPIAGPGLMDSFLHWIHLPFHEAGHTLMMPFGSFLYILGGSLGQLLVPLAVTIAFLRRSDPFAAAFGTWWLGTSFVDLAPYIADARARVLPLLSGVTGQEDWEGHDWYQLLSRTGTLAWDRTLARTAWAVGAALILAALAWGAWVVWRQWAPGRREAGL